MRRAPGRSPRGSRRSSSGDPAFGDESCAVGWGAPALPAVSAAGSFARLAAAPSYADDLATRKNAKHPRPTRSSCCRLWASGWLQYSRTCPLARRIAIASHACDCDRSHRRQAPALAAACVTRLPRPLTTTGPSIEVRSTPRPGGTGGQHSRATHARARSLLRALSSRLPLFFWTDSFCCSLCCSWIPQERGSAGHVAARTCHRGRRR